MISLFIRNHITDRSLASLRKQISSLLPANSIVLEVGCANGRLLFEIAHSIKKGYGIDVDEKMIHYAKRKARKNDINNLIFFKSDIREWKSLIVESFNHVVASLCLHEMERDTAVSILKDFQKLADKIIIADLFEPNLRLQKWLLHFDEWMARHLDKYKSYRDNGGMESIIKEAELTIQSEYPTRIPAVKIWVCHTKNNRIYAA
jgi:SAM-dependent methyltransferase